MSSGPSIRSGRTGRHLRSGEPRPWRRASVVAATLAVVASYGVLQPAAAFAAVPSVTGSSFEIDPDANLTVDGSAPAIDWLDGTTLRSGAVVTHDATSGNDDIFGQGTKEDSAVPTVVSSPTPDKTDLKDFGLYVERNANGVFLNVFWTRTQDPTGTTNMDFEFNQSSTTRNDGTPADIIPVRTVGDLLLTYDLSNGGTKATISRRLWLGTQWGPAQVLTDAQALGSINTTAIAAADSGGLGALGARTFGEASVSLDALLPAGAGAACTNYGSAYLKSRSSDTFSAELKDFIAPHSVSISNCGSVQVRKTDANGPLAGAGFTLYRDLTQGTGPAVTLAANAVGACTTDATGTCTITSVHKGDYFLVETTVPAGHDAAPDTFVQITNGDQLVEVPLVDPIQYGTITVTKDAVPNDAQDFSFAVDSTAFALDDDNDATLPSSRTFRLPVGSHTVSETAIPAGWSLSGLSCTGGAQAPTISGATATVVLAKGETVVCAYTDTATPRAVGLTTSAAAVTGGWQDTATLTGDGRHPVTGTVTFFACPAAPTASACSTGGSQVGSPVAVGSGTATSSTYAPAADGWTCFRAEYASTSSFYLSGTHTNATSECFLSAAQPLVVGQTSSPSYARAFTWTIAKAVDQASLSVPGGSTATSAYDVTVAHTQVDSGWVVDGSITVTNPNRAAFTGVTVTDLVGNGGTCVVTGGSGLTVPAGGSVTLPYRCTYATAPSPAASTDTARATWDATAASTPTGTSVSSVAVDFGAVAPTLTDALVTVTDTLKGTLGTVSATSASNPTAFHYTVDRTGAAGACSVNDNTAAFVTDTTATKGSASASVQLCSPSVAVQQPPAEPVVIPVVTPVIPVVTPQAPAALPRTGGDTALLLRLAVELMVLGGALTLWSRRRSA